MDVVQNLTALNEDLRFARENSACFVTASGGNFQALQRQGTGNNAADADVLHADRQEQGISTRRYLLPMIETNGRLEERPDLNDVVQSYQDWVQELAGS